MPETQRFYEAVGNFFIQQEGDLSFKVLTGIVKAGSMALILVGLGKQDYFCCLEINL